MKKRHIIFILLIVCLLQTRLFAQTARLSGAQQRETMIAYAKTFIGTPYLFGGSTKSGMDCSGFIFTVVRDSLKITVPRTTAQLYAFAEPISTVKLEPGDLVFFKTTSSGAVSHVGIYLGRSQFIHSASDGPNTGVIISSLNEAYWKRTYFSAGSFLPRTGASAEGGITAAGEAGEAAGSFGAASTGTGPAAAAQEAERQRQAARAARQTTFKGVSIESSLLFNWFLFTEEGFHPTFRGVNFSAGLLIDGKFALNIGLRYDTTLKRMMMPITLQFLLGYGFRFYWGPAPNFTADEALPLVTGFSWQADIYTHKSFKLSFVQDISYVISDLSSPQSWFSRFPSKMTFCTGLRITFPLG